MLCVVKEALTCRIIIRVSRDICVCCAFCVFLCFCVFVFAVFASRRKMITACSSPNRGAIGLCSLYQWYLHGDLLVGTPIDRIVHYHPRYRVYDPQVVNRLAGEVARCDKQLGSMRGSIQRRDSWHLTCGMFRGAMPGIGRGGWAFQVYWEA